MADETKYWGRPADPATKECDWCGFGSTAKYSFPVYRKQGQRSKGIRPGQYIYACERHQGAALRASASTGASRKSA